MLQSPRLIGRTATFLFAFLPASVLAQAVTIESAVHDLFGGRIVIGEVPKVIPASIPLLEGVEVVAAHVVGERFSAILSFEREPMSLVAEYAEVVGKLGWRAVKAGPDKNVLSFCTAEEALVQIHPQLGQGGGKAKVEFQPESPLCKLATALRRPWANPALELVGRAEDVPGCTSGGGGGGGSGDDRLTWEARWKCSLGIEEIVEHHATRWRQLGWTRRVGDEGRGQHLSTWNVPEFQGRGWYAVFLVSVSEGGWVRFMLHLSADPESSGSGEETQRGSVGWVPPNQRLQRTEGLADANALGR